MNIGFSAENFPPFPKSRSWKARWIWHGAASSRSNEFVLFRKEFTTNSEIELLLHITAETRYRVWIDGERLGDGPPQCVPAFKIFDTHSLSLSPGAHCLAILVNGPYSLDELRGGLLAELESIAGECLLASDETWMSCRPKAWRSDTFRFRMNVTAPHQEWFDARQLPPEWNQTGVPLSDDWHPAGLVHSSRHGVAPPAMVEPWLHLVPRCIPLLVEDSLRPKRITAVDECLDLSNRMRSEDLSIGLSQAGRPLQSARVENAESLISGEGPTTLACSAITGSQRFDGRHDPCLILDFDRVENAYVTLDVEGDAGAVLEIGYAERLTDGHFNIAIEGQFADRIVLQAGRQSFMPLNWRAFRFVRLRLRNSSSPVLLHHVTATTIGYPFEALGAFSSEDDVLNQAFAISQRTIALCSHDSIVDTPWRENAQWLGDVSAVTLGGLYACFGEVALTGKFLRQAAVKVTHYGVLSNLSNSTIHFQTNNIPDYSLWWVMALWEFYEYSGDGRYIDALYPKACGIIQCHAERLNARGLIENMPFWTFVDWANVDKRGESAAYNAIFAGALQAFEQMAKYKADAYHLKAATSMLDAMRTHFQDRFWDKEQGVLVDAMIDGQPSEFISEHANFAAILWGLVDSATADTIIARFFETEPRQPATEAEPFFTSVVLRALAKRDRRDLGLQIIRERWGERMIARGATSTWEEWGMNGTWRKGEDKFYPVYRSLSHAWSAFPAEFLTKYMIGLEIIEPGCQAIRLDPFTSWKDYTVTYPTPLGIIEVAVKNDSVQVRTPDGMWVDTEAESVPERS